MQIRKLFYSLFLSTVVLSSCNQVPSLSYKLNGKDTLYICDLAKVPEQVKDINLSELVDSFHIIYFENSDIALFKPWKVYITNQYIGILQDAMSPFKLFDRTGSYLCDIGGIGQAEGEYTTLYSAAINELEKTIWLAPFNGDKLLKYKMSGDLISSIKVRSMRKPVIRCEEDNTLTIANLFFKNMPGFLYLRLLTNDSIYYSANEKEYSLNPYDSNGNFIGYNHEVWFYNNTSIFNYMTSANNTLLSYDPIKDKTIPRFMVHTLINEHYYVFDELPSRFLISIYNAKGIGGQKLAIADKITGKTSYVKIQNDFLGGFPVKNFTPRNGWYYEMFEPVELIDLIEEYLSTNNISEDKKKHLNKLLTTIDKNGNNILFLGKLSR